MLLRSRMFWAGVQITLAAVTLTEQFHETIYAHLGEALGTSAANVVSSIAIGAAGFVLVLVGYRIVRRFLDP